MSLFVQEEYLSWFYPKREKVTRLAEAKNFFGDSLILSGNLDQVVFLKNATVNEVCDTVAGIVETGKSGGNFIFAASDFLEKETPEENIRAAVETAIDTGRYA